MKLEDQLQNVIKNVCADIFYLFITIHTLSNLAQIWSGVSRDDVTALMSAP